MYRPILRLAVQAITDATAAESKLVGPLLKETSSKLGRLGAEIATAEAASINPIAKEAAEQLSATVADRTRKELLTLGKGIQPNTAKAALDQEKILAHGSTGKLVNGQRGKPRADEAGQRHVTQRAVEEMSDIEANLYIKKLMDSQERILAHNLRIVQRNPDSLGRFAQVSIFRPLQGRFDALKTNKDLKFLAVGDGSALDAVGADALVVNIKTKHMWLADIKPKPYLDPKSGELIERGFVPSARSNSLVEYESSLFRMTPKGWTLNDQSFDFKRFINNSAGKLISLGEKPSLFSVTKTPPPSFLPSSPADAMVGVSRFQSALRQSQIAPMQEYATALNSTLRYLRSPEAAMKFKTFGTI